MTKTRKKQKKHLEDLNEKYYGKNKNVDYKKISIIEQIKRDIDSIFFYNLNFKYNWCKKLFIFLKKLFSYFPYAIRVPTEYIIAFSLHTFTKPLNIIIICIFFSYCKKVVMNNITDDSQGQTFSQYGKYELNVGFNPLQKIVEEKDTNAGTADLGDYYGMGEGTAYGQYFDDYADFVNGNSQDTGLNETYKKETDDLINSHRNELDEINNSHRNKLDEINNSHRNELDEINNRYNREIDECREEIFNKSSKNADLIVESALEMREFKKRENDLRDKLEKTENQLRGMIDTILGKDNW